MPILTKPGIAELVKTYTIPLFCCFSILYNCPPTPLNFSIKEVIR